MPVRAQNSWVPPMSFMRPCPPAAPSTSQNPESGRTNYMHFSLQPWHSGQRVVYVTCASSTKKRRLPRSVGAVGMYCCSALSFWLFRLLPRCQFPILLLTILTYSSPKSQGTSVDTPRLQLLPAEPVYPPGSQDYDCGTITSQPNTTSSGRLLRTSVCASVEWESLPVGWV